MPEELFIIALTAIVFGTGFLAFLFWNIFSLIRCKIDKDAAKNQAVDPQFFKALGEWKRSTEKRLTNLEAIVTDEEVEDIKIGSTSATGEIEIEDETVRKKEDTKGGNLRNMLNE